MAKPTDDRSTPAWVFDPLHERFAFDLDVCATEDNAKVRNYFGPDRPEPYRRNALAKSLRWGEYGTAWWMNCPYSEIPLWLRKVRLQLLLADEPCRCICLLPVSTSTKWWHKYIWNESRQAWHAHVGYVSFLPKRIDFAPHFTGAMWPNIVVELRLP